MDDFQEVALSDDEEMEGVGFGEFPDLPTGDGESGPETELESGDDGTPEEHGEPEKEKAAPPEPAEPEAKPPETPKTPDEVAELKRYLAQQQQAVYALQQQIEMQNQRFAQAQAQQKTEDRGQKAEEWKPPTDEEWASDPNEATRKISEHVARQVAADIQGRQQQAPARQQAPAQQQVHPWVRSAQAGQQVLPQAFVAGTKENQLANQIMEDPRYGLMNNPDGPRIAAVMAKERMEAAGQIQSGQRTEGANPAGQDAHTPPQDGRKKPPVVHGGGRKRAPTGVQLTADQRRAAKLMGVSEESYAKTLKDMENG